MTTIKNWAKFQHFKDRRPPWIKLYRDILDDKEWHKLDPIAAKDLVSFWLIASEYDGELPDIETLAFRMRRPESDVLASISKLSHWLEHDDIGLISACHHVAPVADVSDHQERETERETETEEEKKAPRKRAASPDVVECPEDVAEQVWKDWVQHRKAKRATVTKTVIDGAREEAAKANLTLEGFLKVWVRRGTQGLEADWLKPNERGTASPTGETPYQRQMRERMQAVVPGIAAKAPGSFGNVIELEARDVTSRCVGR
jgi:hypothetical protein